MAEPSLSEQREAAREQIRVGLAGAGFDGPFDIQTGDVMAMVWGANQMYAVCLSCGAMVMLGDGAEIPGRPGMVFERGIGLHVDWHQSYPKDGAR